MTNHKPTGYGGLYPDRLASPPLLILSSFGFFAPFTQPIRKYYAKVCKAACWDCCVKPIKVRPPLNWIKMQHELDYCAHWSLESMDQLAIGRSHSLPTQFGIGLTKLDCN